MSAAESRRIVLFRHAKADWPQVTDHERPLAERGRMEAAEAGRRLADSAIPFDLALCSTATRTRETWKLAVHEFQHRPKTVYEERIYEASPGKLVALLNETPDEVRNILLVGHNPAVQGLTDVLSGSVDDGAHERLSRRGFPPAAFAVLSFDGTWKSVEPGVATLIDYWAPSD